MLDRLKWEWCCLQLKQNELDRAAKVEALRGPSTLFEEYLGAGLQALAAANTDNAQQQNGVGFNKPDSYSGNRWAAKLRAMGGLTDVEWSRVADCLVKYEKQLKRVSIIKPG